MVMLSGTEGTGDQMNTWEIYRPVSLLSWVSVPIVVGGGVESLSCVQLSVTPWTIAHQASLSEGFFQTRILEWIVISFSRGSSQPRAWTQASCIGSQILYQWATKEASLPIAMWKFRMLSPPWRSSFLSLSQFPSTVDSSLLWGEAGQHIFPRWKLMQPELWDHILQTWQVEGIGQLVPVWNSAPRTAFSHSFPTHSPEEI